MGLNLSPTPDFGREMFSWEGRVLPRTQGALLSRETAPLPVGVFAFGFSLKFYSGARGGGGDLLNSIFLGEWKKSSLVNVGSLRNFRSQTK